MATNKSKIQGYVKRSLFDQFEQEQQIWGLTQSLTLERILSERYGRKETIIENPDSFSNRITAIEADVNKIKAMDLDRSLFFSNRIRKLEVLLGITNNSLGETTGITSNTKQITSDSLDVSDTQQITSESLSSSDTEQITSDSPDTSDTEQITSDSPDTSDKEQITSDSLDVSDTQQITSESLSSSDTEQITSDSPDTSDTEQITSDSLDVSDTQQITSESLSSSDTEQITSDSPDTSDTEQITSDSLDVSDTQQITSESLSSSDTEQITSDSPDTSDTEQITSDSPDTSDKEQITSDSPDTSDTEQITSDSPDTSDKEQITSDSAEIIRSSHPYFDRFLVCKLRPGHRVEYWGENGGFTVDIRQAKLYEQKRYADAQQKKAQAGLDRIAADYIKISIARSRLEIELGIEKIPYSLEQIFDYWDRQEKRKLARRRSGQQKNQSVAAIV